MILQHTIQSIREQDWRVTRRQNVGDLINDIPLAGDAGMGTELSGNRM